MDRVVGIETEYGCLLSEDEPHVNSELWPAKVKNYLFRKADAGTIDLHYRDYEEPPGNGGFLLNGGRLYLDMGHIEYASPECLHLHDLVSYELAGDDLLRSALIALGAEDRVSFIKNNVDHHTGATFGCHENYLMRREAPCWSTRCRSRWPFPARRASNGWYASRTAKRSARTMCSGNFIIRRKSISGIAARKPAGCWKTARSFWKPSRTTGTR